MSRHTHIPTSKSDNKARYLKKTRKKKKKTIVTTPKHSRNIELEMIISAHNRKRRKRRKRTLKRPTTRILVQFHFRF